MSILKFRSDFNACKKPKKAFFTLIVKLLFLLLRKGLGAIIKRISLLKGIDAFLGMLVGLTEGILLISSIISVLNLIPSDTLAAYLNNSAVVGLLYNHNPIIWLIGLFI